MESEHVRSPNWRIVRVASLEWHTLTTLSFRNAERGARSDDEYLIANNFINTATSPPCASGRESEPNAKFRNIPLRPHPAYGAHSLRQVLTAWGCMVGFGLVADAKPVMESLKGAHKSTLFDQLYRPVILKTQIMSILSMKRTNRVCA